MCVEVIFPDGEVVGTASRLSERVGALVIEPGYEGVNMADACLCAVDLGRTLGGAGLRVEEDPDGRVWVK